jgi:DNA-binding FadR family transcriptional regulator
MPRDSNLEPEVTTKSGRSHTTRVVDALGLAIVSGQQAEGSLLPGDVELLERFGVSRTVLREALKTLAAKGMVQARARVGTRVRPRSSWNLFDPDVLMWHAEAGFRPEFLAHLAEIRMALEPEAAALAALRRTRANLDAINGWVEEMDKPRISPDDFVKADLGFHLAVADAAANPFFISISTLIEVVLVAMLTISSPADDAARLTESVEQHRQIADAIASRDPDTARRAMRTVIDNGVDAVRRAQRASV